MANGTAQPIAAPAPAAAAAPDVWDSAIAESQAGRPASTNSKSADVFDNAINDSLAGRPPMAGTTDTTGASDTTGVLGHLKSAGEGYLQGSGDIWDALKSAATSPTPGTPLALASQVEQVLPLFQAFHKAHSGGASVIDSLKAASDVAVQHVKNIIPLKAAVAAYNDNPTRFTARAVTDAAAVATSLFAGDAVGAPETAAPETEADAGAPEAVDSLNWLQRANPFRSATPAVDTAAATSKIEPAVTARTAKAGLASGDVGVTPKAAELQTTQSALDAQKATQENVNTTIQNIAARHATENGLPAPVAGTATRDVLTTNGDALVEAGKANYKILDKYTDSQFTNAQNELKNAQQELRTKAGMTDVDTSDLEANVTRAQWNVDQLFDNAVKNGMPKETADLARTQFRTGQATLDAANDVRMANKVTGAGTRTTNLNTLENRWTARYDSGRLQQALGEQGAKDALTQVHAAREAGEVFQSMPPTESQALRDLITKHTETGKFGTTTDWGAVRKEFSGMPDKATRFSDIPKVEKFINNQRFYQNAWRTVKVGAGLLGGGALTGEGWNLVH